jgi:hypothetical protein
MESSTSSSSGCLFSSTVNLSPVKEAKEELLAAVPNTPVKLSPPGLTTATTHLSPEIRFGDITTTDTVIKISVPVTAQGARGVVQDDVARRRLFPEDNLSLRFGEES